MVFPKYFFANEFSSRIDTLCSLNNKVMITTLGYQQRIQGARESWSPSDSVKDYLFAALALNKYNFPHYFPYFFCNILPIFIVPSSKNFPVSPWTAYHFKTHPNWKVLPVSLCFTYFRVLGVYLSPNYSLIRAYISCNMKTNALMIFYLF